VMCRKIKLQICQT